MDAVAAAANNFRRLINLDPVFRSAGMIWIKNQQTLIFSTMVILEEISKKNIIFDHFTVSAYARERGLDAYNIFNYH